MRGPVSLVSFVSLALLACALSGCERGCGWVKARKKTVTEIPATFGPAIDCPDGLARCVGGIVEVSRLARIPMPCAKTETPEDCACPWAAVADCPHGCAADGVTLPLAEDRAAARLCVQEPSKPVSRPAPAAVPPPGACGGGGQGANDDGVKCVASLVVACVQGDDGGVASHVVAACLRGCAHDGDLLDARDLTPEGASRILCAP